MSGPQERVSHKTSGESRVWGSQDGPELLGAEDTSAFTLVTSLALLIKFSASFLQCLWKYNFVQDIHVQLRIVCLMSVYSHHSAGMFTSFLGVDCSWAVSVGTGFWVSVSVIRGPLNLG